MAEPKNINENNIPINALPEYRIRTMKDDMAKFAPAPPEKLPIAEEKVIEKAPLPSPEELVSKEKQKKIPKPKPEPPKPKIKRKTNFKFLIIILVIAIGVGGFLYWIGARPEPSRPSDEGVEQPEQPTPSETLFPVNQTEIISLIAEISLSELLKQEAQEEQLTKTFKRIGILKNELEFLSLTEFFQEMKINIPPYALAELGNNYTLAIYNQNGIKRLGLVTEIKNIENLKEHLPIWEETMITDLKNFLLIETLPQPASSKFLDNIYPPAGEVGQQTAIRYVNFPEPDLTIDYAIKNNLFILTSSRESMYRILDSVDNL